MAHGAQPADSRASAPPVPPLGRRPMYASAMSRSTSPPSAGAPLAAGAPSMPCRPSAEARLWSPGASSAVSRSACNAYTHEQMLVYDSGMWCPRGHHRHLGEPSSCALSGLLIATALEQAQRRLAQRLLSTFPIKRPRRMWSLARMYGLASTAFTSPRLQPAVLPMPLG